MGLRAGYARHLLRVEDDAVPHDRPAAPRVPRAHDSTECPAATRSRSRRPMAARSSRRQLRQRPNPLGESAGIPAREALLGLEQLVEDRVRREDGQTCRRGLVDDLVGRAGAHVVDEGVVRREQLRKLGTRHRIADRHAAVEPELRDELLELGAVRPFLVGERRAVHVQLDVVAGERHGGDRDVEPLRGRVTPEREQAHAVPVARRRARELVEVDPVADRTELPRGQGERALVDARHRRRDAFRRPQESARAPVREPEDERDPERPHERCREHGVDRAHVRDDRPAAQPSEARAPAQPRSARREVPCAAPGTCARGSSPAAPQAPRRRRAPRPRRRVRRAPGSSGRSRRARDGPDRPAA